MANKGACGEGGQGPKFRLRSSQLTACDNLLSIVDSDRVWAMSMWVHPQFLYSYQL